MLSIQQHGVAARFKQLCVKAYKHKHEQQLGNTLCPPLDMCLPGPCDMSLNSSIFTYASDLMQLPLYSASDVQTLVQSLHSRLLQGCFLAKDILLHLLHNAGNGLEVMPCEGHQ